MSVKRLLLLAPLFILMLCVAPHLAAARKHATNGACGSSNGMTLTSAPTTNLCSAGTASTVSGTGPWTWSCAGSGGGSTVQCSAALASSAHVTITAPANNASVSSPVMVNAYVDSTTCNGGFNHLQILVNGTIASAGSGSCTISASVNTPAGTDTITVQAIKYDGTVMAQSAVTVTDAQPVNGQCGSMNGTTTNVKPTTNLCSVGTASTVSGTGPWTWSCAGSNGGTTAQCSANPPSTGSACPPGSIVITSGNIQTAVNNTPVGGILCLNGGSYSLSGTVSVGKSITIAGVNYPQITQTFSGPMFSITASNVTVYGLSMTGANRNKTGDSCSGTGAINIGAVGNVTITNNIVDTFTCGFVLSNTNGFIITANLIKNIKYAAMTAYPGLNGTIDRNTIINLDSDGPHGENAYGITASGNVSRSITISNNYVNNAPTWECYDTHDGQSIYFINNVCYRAGTVGINTAYSGVMQVSDIRVEHNIIDETGLASVCDSGSNTFGCNSIVLTGSGQILNNVIRNYTNGNCYIYGPTATISGSSCSQGTSDITPPSVPTGVFTTVVSGTQIGLSWNAATDNVGVTGYDIYRDGTLIASSVASTSYLDAGLVAGTGYSYAVRSKDAAGNASVPSLTVSASPSGG